MISLNDIACYCIIKLGFFGRMEDKLSFEELEKSSLQQLIDFYLSCKQTLMKLCNGKNATNKIAKQI